METSESRLSRVDLNLLKAFQVLMAERSVTGAARRLFISQPAMSKTLHRLRETFGDPLFMPTRKGLVPTPRAIELSPPVGAALAQLAETLFAAPFDPALASGEINVQIPDALSMAVIPHLYVRLQKHAKNLQLATDNLTANHLEMLASGKADFSIYMEQDVGHDFMTFPIGISPPVCWMREGHPLSKLKALTMENVLSYPLVVLAYHSQQAKALANGPHSEVNALYRDYRLDKVASLVTSQLLTALTVLLESNALMLGTAFRFKSYHGKQGLITRPVVIGDLSKTSFSLIQHRRTETSPLHSWLRDQILESWAGDA